MRVRAGALRRTRLGPVLGTFRLSASSSTSWQRRVPDTWKAELGPDWAQTWQSLRHTLSNLTLTAFNPEMGNRPFHDKRDAEKGYRDSPPRLNADLRQTERWDGDTIRARGARLADEAVGIWKRPVLSDRALEPYSGVGSWGRTGGLN